MSINVEAPATEKHAQSPCTYRAYLGGARVGEVRQDYPCPFCDEGVGHERIAGTESQFRLIPLNDAEVKEVAAGLYMLDCIIASRSDVLHGEDDCGLLYWNSDRSLHAEYERRARTLIDDPFVHPRQALAFARLVGGLGL